MEPYEVDRDGEEFNIWHFDFFRFNDPQEFEDAGFRDVFASRGLKLAEWPEKAEALLPMADLQIHIEPIDDALSDSLGNAPGTLLGTSRENAPGNESRSVRLTAHTALGTELIA
jgi:hypothetical protein